MLNEVITRIDVAYDQVLTASIIGPRDTLVDEDRNDLNQATDLLKGILDRNKEKNG